MKITSGEVKNNLTFEHLEIISLPLLFSLMLRLFTRFYVPMVLLLAVIFYIISEVKSKHELHSAILRGESEITIRKSNILNILTPLVTNNKYLGSIGLLNTNITDTVKKKKLVNNLIQFTKGQSFFEQVRILDTLGKEVLRINGFRDSIQVVADDNLQDKSLRDYFKVATLLEPGEMYISPIELNKEYNAVDLPYRAVVRIVSPIYSGTNDVCLGYFVTNISVANLLSAFSRTLMTDNFPLMLLNHNGEGIIKTKEQILYRFNELKELSSIKDSLPLLFGKLEEKKTRYVKHGDGIFVFEKLKLTEELAVNNFLKEVTFIQPTNSDVYLVTYVALSNIGAFGGLNKVDVNLMIILFFLLLIVALMLTKRKMNELEMIDEITILNKKLYADQEKLEESIAQLSRRNTQLKEFSQIISHNIRSPLAGLTLLIDFLHQDQMKLSEQEKKEVIEKLIFSAKTLNNLTDDLFETVSVLDSGELVFEEIDLLKALDKSKDVLTAQILQANASIEVDTNAWRNIKYNRQYLESIIFNLLSNALKYRDENRALVLKITTEIVEGKKVLKVSDNGRGINLEWHGENVFGLHKTFHRDSSGKGFGLFMTKTQIETLGGKIRVESEVGKGSTFIITF